MTIFGLAYGHVASNMGDLALNLGVRKLVERVPDATLKVALLMPNEALIESARATFGPPGTEVVFLDSEIATPEWLIECCTTPEAYFKETDLGDVDVVLLHSSEHLFAPQRPTDPLTLWRILPGLAAKATGRKAIVLPSTFGPFDDGVTSNLIRILLATADAAATRESSSSSLVKEAFGLRLPSLLDPAFLISDSEAHRPPSANGQIQLGMALRIEEFGLRAGTEMSRERSRRFQESGFRDSMAFSFAGGVMERLFPAVDADLTLLVQTIADSGLQKAIAREGLTLPGSTKRIRVVRTESVDDYHDAISNLDMLVSARFHGCILSMAAGVPAVGVHMASHGHKMPGLFELLGVRDYCLSLTQENAHDAGRLVPHLFRQRVSSFDDVWLKIADLQLRMDDWFLDAVETPTIDTREAALEGLKLVRLEAIRLQ